MSQNPKYKIGAVSILFHHESINYSVKLLDQSRHERRQLFCHCLFWLRANCTQNIPLSIHHIRFVVQTGAAIDDSKCELEQPSRYIAVVS